MIGLTCLSSEIETDNWAVIIPGGPGLSSQSLRSLDLLRRSVNLSYVDFQGANGLPYTRDASHEELVTALRLELEKVLPSSAKVFAIGHSHGGFFAASLANLESVVGIYCLATPFSQRSLRNAFNNYQNSMTPALKEATQIWNEKKDDESLKHWISEYGTLYFLKPGGKELMLRERVSSKLFLANRSDANRFEGALDDLASAKKQKVFIAAKQDGLLSVQDLEADARRGGFRFFTIDNASHFLTFDQPEKVASLIEECIATSREG